MNRVVTLMPSIHHDLHVTSYGLIGVLFVGQEVVGLGTAMLVALAFIGLLIAISLAASLVSYLRQSRIVPPPPKQVGRRP